MCFSNSLPIGKHKTLDESLSLWVIEHMHKAFASIKRFSSHDGFIAQSDGHLIRKCGHGDTERLIESPSVTSHIAGEYQNRAWHAGVLAQSLLLIAPRCFPGGNRTARNTYGIWICSTSCWTSARESHRKLFIPRTWGSAHQVPWDHLQHWPWQGHPPTTTHHARRDFCKLPRTFTFLANMWLKLVDTFMPSTVSVGLLCEVVSDKS